MKKEITIAGILLAPIEVGFSAFIRNTYEERRTSTVVRVLERTEKRIRFETRNSIYTLMCEGK